MRRSQFFLFCCVGGAGFLIDLAISLLLINLCGAHHLFSRIISWLIAVTLTFFLNAVFSFRVLSRVSSSRSLCLRAFVGYLISQSLGGAVNVIVFMLISVVLKFGVLAGVIWGAAFGVAFNYFGARKVLRGGKASA